MFPFVLKYKYAANQWYSLQAHQIYLSQNSSVESNAAKFFRAIRLEFIKNRNSFKRKDVAIFCKFPSVEFIHHWIHIDFNSLILDRHLYASCISINFEIIFHRLSFIQSMQRWQLFAIKSHLSALMEKFENPRYSCQN